MICEATLPLWEEMRQQQIFITGGTGFFGRWLLESFAYVNRTLDLRAKVTVLSRDPHSFTSRVPHIASDTAFSFIEGDIRTFTFPEGTFPFVIHAAAEVARVTSSADPLERIRAIEQGTERTLRFASTHGTRKYLLVSSGAAYGQQPAGISHVPENYAGAPSTLDASSAYGEGKRLSELMCAMYSATVPIEFKIARCFAFAGPALPLDANFAIGNFIADAAAGRTVSIMGDGTPTRSYLYAADLAVWLWTILFRAPSLEIFNVGSEQAINVADLARLVVKVLDVRSEVEIAQTPVDGATVKEYIPSTRKAHRMLQLRQTVSLEESIRRMAAWYAR
jgi:nucleoside-diphosphate-sugar epimerase